jgi:hypothetical protein
MNLMKKPASVTGIKLVGLHRQSFENAIGNNWHNIVHPDDVQVIMDIYLPAFEKEPYFIPAIKLSGMMANTFGIPFRLIPILR